MTQVCTVLSGQRYQIGRDFTPRVTNNFWVDAGFQVDAVEFGVSQQKFDEVLDARTLGKLPVVAILCEGLFQVAHPINSPRCVLKVCGDCPFGAL
jgi:hypothetical protein